MEVENKRSDFTATWSSLSPLYFTKFSYLVRKTLFRKQLCCKCWQLDNKGFAIDLDKNNWKHQSQSIWKISLCIRCKLWLSLPNSNIQSTGVKTEMQSCLKYNLTSSFTKWILSQEPWYGRSHLSLKVCMLRDTEGLWIPQQGFLV